MYTFKEATDLAAFDRFLETHGGQYIQSSHWQTVKPPGTAAMSADMTTAEKRSLRS